MTHAAISVENLGKAYRLGVKDETPDTLVGALHGMVRAPLKNWKQLSRLNTFRHQNDSDDLFWALKDVSFEVQEGEVLGVIGRNGAGKSTLLKILSRITEPTTGRAVIRGRVSSLLEVGTGFHPELSGRDNIYMNGTILGMTKREIDGKFDQIVDFSGVEKFLDTPIKRYSSGMKVRLAFSVAAHLEPEILIIDEVLAVGDAEFQKKCLGKMQDVARGGRTVLFVSHNMAAIQNLCTRAIVLRDGGVGVDAAVDDAIDLYMSFFTPIASDHDLSHLGDDRYGTGLARFKSAVIESPSAGQATQLRMGEPFSVKLAVEAAADTNQLALGIGLFSDRGDRIAGLNSAHTGRFTFSLKARTTTEFSCEIGQPNLLSGRYYLNLQLKESVTDELVDSIERALCFEVIDSDVFGTGRIPRGAGVIFLRPEWRQIATHDQFCAPCSCKP